MPPRDAPTRQPAHISQQAPGLARTRLWMHGVVVLGACLLTMLGTSTLIELTAPDHGGVYQGLARELGNGLTGGRYRVGLHCRLKDNTAAFAVRGGNAVEARASLEWSLPACEMTRFSEHSPGGGPNSYHGEFLCPANFYKRTVKLSAPNIEQAMVLATEGSRGCTIEFADQTACPWLDNGCALRSIDLREAAPLSPVRRVR